MDVLVEPLPLIGQLCPGAFLRSNPSHQPPTWGMALVLEPAQHSLPWQETPGSSATRLAGNAKGKGLFREWLPGYAIPRCPPPRPSWSVFKAPKEAFWTFKHLVYMKIPPCFPRYLQSLFDVESHFTDGETEEQSK